MTEQGWVRNSDLAILTINASETYLCSKEKATNGIQGGLWPSAYSGQIPWSPARDHLSTTKGCLQRDLCGVRISVPWEIEAEVGPGSVPLCRFVLGVRGMFGKAVAANGEWRGECSILLHTLTTASWIPAPWGTTSECGLTLAWQLSRDLRPHVP